MEASPNKNMATPTHTMPLRLASLALNSRAVSFCAAPSSVLARVSSCSTTANACAAYHDYREMFARKDLDAVMLAVPDHWHALVATAAAERGLDIYGEKPLAKTIAEQQAIVGAAKKNNIIWQTGSWQRSQAPFHKAAEIVRNGLIGEVTRVEVGLPSGHTDFKGTRPELVAKLAALKINDPVSYTHLTLPTIYSV